jgi:uncharacterized membrane protein (DUF106 family)
MTDVLAQIVGWLNTVANALGRIVFAPIAVLPGWLSATLVAVVTGVLLLIAFKYTSNQQAIRRARNDINANLLALKLFKDNTATVFKSQGGVLLGAARLFVLAIVPMLVMVVPVTLLIAQLALWYQARPLRVGDEAVLAVKLKRAEGEPPEVQLDPSEAVEVLIGPFRLRNERAVYWRVVARRPGMSQLVFHTSGQTAEKELAIGDRYQRVSEMRPRFDWVDMLMHPWEQPFPPDAAVQSIQIEYPPRDSWTSGTNAWIVYWFVASMVAAFVFRPWLNVNI